MVALVQYMIRTRGRETVRVTEVKGHAENIDVEGHAEDVDIQQGRVRLEGQVGNAEADTAADLGRRHQSEVLIKLDVGSSKLVVTGTLSCLICIDL